jgi:Big-like domain-containing protein
MSGLYGWSSVVGALLALSALACWNEPNEHAAMLVLTSAPSGWAQNRVTLPREPVVQLTDADGNPVKQAGTDVTVAITAGQGVLVGPMTVRTDTSGAATFEDLSLAGEVGVKTLTFSAPGLLGAKSTINLIAGVAASIAARDGNGQTGTPGAAVALQPSVLVTDADGNPVPDVAVTFAVASGGGSITNPFQITDPSGIAGVGSWTLGSTAGTDTLTARAEGLTGSPITFTASGTAELSPGIGCFVDDQGRTYCADPGPVTALRSDAHDLGVSYDLVR